MTPLSDTNSVTTILAIVLFLPLWSGPVPSLTPIRTAAAQIDMILDLFRPATWRAKILFSSRRQDPGGAA